MNAKHYVLIHGAWHNASCFEKILPLLHQAGATVEALDLPGHGRDATPPKNIHLSTYIDFVCDHIKTCQRTVTLVGHSFAGIILSGVISRIPEWISQAIYIAAFVPRDGQSLFRIAESWAPSPLERRVNPEASLIELDALPAAAILYSDADPEEYSRIAELLQAEPLHPMMEPVSLPRDPYRAVPCHYIAAKHDLAISFENQMAMVEGVIDQVSVLESDHSPFYTQAEALASLIKSV